MRRMPFKPTCRHPRAGLAPLEFVLGIPMLLFLLALMINFADASRNKIKALNASREAVWSGRSPQNGASFPHWFESLAVDSTSAGVGGDDDVFKMFGTDAELLQPHSVARGPVLSGTTGGNSVPVNSDVLNPTKDAIVGRASLDQTYPLLPKLGGYRLGGSDPLLRSPFRYFDMGLSRNDALRINHIYDLSSIRSQVEQEMTAYNEAAIANAEMYFFQGDPYPLQPLDDDDDLREAFGNPTDFHRRVTQQRTEPLSDVRARMQRDIYGDGLNDGLIKNVEGDTAAFAQGLPEHMTETFYRAYETLINRAEAEIAALNGSDPARASYLQGRITQWESYQEELQAFFPLIPEKVSQTLQ